MAYETRLVESPTPLEPQVRDPRYDMRRKLTFRPICFELPAYRSDMRLVVCAPEKYMLEIRSFCNP